jgi:5-methylcytosine-specific restriction protein A
MSFHEDWWKTKKYVYIYSDLAIFKKNQCEPNSWTGFLRSYVGLIGKTYKQCQYHPVECHMVCWNWFLERLPERTLLEARNMIRSQSALEKLYNVLKESPSDELTKDCLLPAFVHNVKCNMSESNVDEEESGSDSSDRNNNNNININNNNNQDSKTEQIVERIRGDNETETERGRKSVTKTESKERGAQQEHTERKFTQATLTAARRKRKKRRHLPTPIRLHIAQQQAWECRTCKCQLGARFEIDHIVGLADGGSNDITNLQALCSNCHSAKTHTEWITRWCKRNTIAKRDFNAWRS